MKELFLAAFIRDRRGFTPKHSPKPRPPLRIERGDRQTLFGKSSRRKRRTLYVYYDIRAYSNAAFQARENK